MYDGVLDRPSFHSRPTPKPVDEFRLPPHNHDAERNVIASAIFEPSVTPDLVTILKSPDLFYRDTHRIIWDLIIRRFAAGESVAPVAMFEALERAGHTKIADPLSETGLAEILANGMTLDPLHEAKIIQQKAVLRATMEVATEILQYGYSNTHTADEVLAHAMAKLSGIATDDQGAGTVTVAELIPGVRDRIIARQHGKPTGLLTGFAELDGVTDGLQPQDLVIVAGRPSMGKTSYALNMCEFMSVDSKNPTLFVSLEMNQDSLTERIYVARARVDGHKVRTGDKLTKEEWARLDKSQDDVDAGANTHIILRPARNFIQICADIRAAYAKHQVKAVFIDYAQLVGSDNPRDTETQATTKVSQAFKALARELNIPVILLSQLNRSLENREDHTPRMADLRSSGSLEQDADLIIFLHRPEKFETGVRPGEADCILAKNRNGRVGTFPLWFREGFMKFEDYIPEFTGQ